MPRAASWTGTPSIRGSSESMRMALLTFSLVGLQFTWGIEMTYCTPYLLQLGLSKSRTSLVWIAGPLSGLIMQPVIGVLADNSKSRWGRRRPFMLGGSVVVGACLLTLGWTAEIVGIFFEEGQSARALTVALAIISIYAVDFAINAVQASCRSLIVDTLPTSKQQLGSAWASRMVAVGSLVGYAVGTIDLVKIFGTTFGNTQFKQMTLIAALFFFASVAVTCWAVGERILVSAREDAVKSSAIYLILKIVKTTYHLPDRIRAICWVQFWSWIGWFPFLFYSATWVGEVHFRYHPHTDAKSSTDTLGDVGRIGSLSLVIFSLVTFAASIVIPWCVHAPDGSEFESRSFTPRPSTGRIGSSLAPAMQYLNDHKPDLAVAWQYSHLIFGLTMIFAPLVKSVAMATLLVSICGISWALTCWAPFAFMGIEINRLAASESSNELRMRSPYISSRPTARFSPFSQTARSSSYPTSSTSPYYTASSSANITNSQASDDALHIHQNNHHQLDDYDYDSDDHENIDDNDHETHDHIQAHASIQSTTPPSIPPYSASDNESGSDVDVELENGHSPAHKMRRNRSDRRKIPVDNTTLLYENSTGETAGIYLGILNLFTTVPQLVGTFIATCVFSILEPGPSPELHDPVEGPAVEDPISDQEGLKVKQGLNGIAVCLAIGALCAFGAALATTRMRRKMRRFHS